MKRRTAKQVFRNLVGQGGEVITRWASMSPTLTGPGRLPLTYGTTLAANPIRAMPVMFTSLTSLPHPGEGITGDNIGFGTYNRGLCRVFYNENLGTWSYQTLASQEPTGATYDLTGVWQTEKNLISTSTIPPRRNRSLFHKYTDIRFNLYGSALYPLRYNIFVCKMPKEWSPLQFNAGVNIAENGEFSTWMKDLTRPLIANPINTNGNQMWRKQIKIIKNYTVDINPLAYSDAAAETAASVHVGNVRQFKLFLRHDRHRRYDWAERDTQTVDDRPMNDLGWDQTVLSDAVLDVAWNQRLYLFITCTTTNITVNPTLFDISNGNPDAYGIGNVLPDNFGTIDCQMRQCFVAPGVF